ncbi:MAG: TonB-dependent receptor [Desulfobulbaceae bacterium]|nr:MAG: TonB-dependent receptor [Desulfobulbaceae bacterium]
MSLTARALQVSSLVCLICHFCSIATAAKAERCGNPAGRLVSVQGEVSVQVAGAPSWSDAGIDFRLCPGDTLRVGEKGRAAVVLANESVLRIGENSALSISTPTPEKVGLLKLLQGILHIFSHRPHSLNIATPFVSGAVEGTEFLVRVMQDRAIITVFEGRVMAANSLGHLAVSSGQSIVAVADQAPRYETVVKPRDAVQWTLYYPPVIDRDRGEAGGTGSFPLAAAAEALAVGRVDEARRLIVGVLDKDAGNGEALALLAIIELTQNNSDEARRLALEAAAADPTSVAAAMAMAYVQQAAFDIPGALATLELARQANPTSAELLARLAELQLSVGELDTAEASAKQAAALNPDIGRIQAVLGFAHLTRIQTEQAKEAFARAIALDPAMPLARLGLGLALIREGDLEKGRAEIEIAAALDPGNALIRSYLGKAYYEEKRDGGAARQYEIARELDPADPTPWFYDALRKQSINRPVEALHDLQKSIELNDNRAVYRSRLLLDEDLAVRGASLGRIYRDLGFQQLALVEGWKSVNTDPTNYSAHRFLADSYSALPRHEIARVSELLQSQLLQPLNITPVQPQMAESNLFILDGAGPAEASLNEYSPLFLRNRLALQASGVAGSNDTFGDEVVQSGVWNRFSYSLGQFHYQTDGFRENNDQEQDIINAYFQSVLSPSTSILGELRYKDKNFGDLTLKFDEEDFLPSLRQHDQTKSIRLGGHHDLSTNSKLIGTVLLSADEGSGNGIETDFASVDIANEADNLTTEIQHLYRNSNLSLRTGAGYVSADENEEFHMSFPFEIVSESDSRTEIVNLYTYTGIELANRSTAILGLSGDILESTIQDKEELNPKIGVIWQPSDNTSLRGAAFRTLNRRLIYGQTIEPTSVAGFNQFYDDFGASSAWNYGIGVDQKFSELWFGGGQYIQRDLDVPFTSVNPTGVMEVVEDEWQEKEGSVFLYWTPCSSVAVGLEYWLEKYSHEQWEGPQGIRELTSHRLSQKISYFHPHGFLARFEVEYVDQQGEFGSNISGFDRGSDQFWIVDCSVAYRLPQRKGLLKLGVNNLFDEKFSYLDTDPGNPRLFPERQVIVSFTVSF